MVATGDAGHFDALAGHWPASSPSSATIGAATGAVLARRGGRRPPHEQVADAAGLLSALRLAPAAVFGTRVLARLDDDPRAGRAPIAAGGLERFWRLVAGERED